MRLLLQSLGRRGDRITSQWPVARDVRHLTSDPRCFHHLSGGPVIDVPVHLGTICTGPLASRYSANVLAARSGIERQMTSGGQGAVREVLENFDRTSTPIATWRCIPPEDCQAAAMSTAGLQRRVADWVDRERPPH
jgi:hypothetical protein